MLATVNTLTDWLLNELHVRDWTQAELARRAGVSRAAISDIISGKRNMGKDLAQSVSEALKIPIEEIYRAAGLLPPKPEENRIIKQIAHLTHDLPEQEQNDILEFVKKKKGHSFLPTAPSVMPKPHTARLIVRNAAWTLKLREPTSSKMRLLQLANMASLSVTRWQRLKRQKETSLSAR